MPCGHAVNVRVEGQVKGPVYADREHPHESGTSWLLNSDLGKRCPFGVSPTPWSGECSLGTPEHSCLLRSPLPLEAVPLSCQVRYRVPDAQASQ